MDRDPGNLGVIDSEWKWVSMKFTWLCGHLYWLGHHYFRSVQQWCGDVWRQEGVGQRRRLQQQQVDQVERCATTSLTPTDATTTTTATAATPPGNDTSVNGGTVVIDDDDHNDGQRFESVPCAETEHNTDDAARSAGAEDQDRLEAVRARNWEARPGSTPRQHQEESRAAERTAATTIGSTFQRWSQRWERESGNQAKVVAL